jgi:hypothetical protein
VSQVESGTAQVVGHFEIRPSVPFPPLGLPLFVLGDGAAVSAARDLLDSWCYAMSDFLSHSTRRTDGRYLPAGALAGGRTPDNRRRTGRHKNLPRHCVVLRP